MTFNSLPFAVFLPAVLVVYYLADRRTQNLVLLAASYCFYGWWDSRFLGLIVLSTSIDYFAGLAIATAGRRSRRRAYLFASVGSNLLILGFFKYYNFFVESASAFLLALGLDMAPPVLGIILPVGISFYTLQSMSYVVDVYRGQVEPCRGFLTYALYVAYFPQLVAGPIERCGRMVPQYEAERRVSRPDIEEALLLILLGFFKKIAVADVIGGLVDARFAQPALATGPELLASLVLFSVQVYCDFSAYSDIACGTSLLFGIRLTANFRRPYFAASVSEFWQRWHISLSTWLRDYVFLPVSFALSRRWDGIRWLGIRDDLWVYSAAALLTMLLSGLWHGAGWMFVAWGGLHGTYLVVQRLWNRSRVGRAFPRGPRRLRRLVASVAVFLLVSATWVVFRTASVPDAWAFLGGIISWRSPVAGGLAPWPGERRGRDAAGEPGGVATSLA